MINNVTMLTTYVFYKAEQPNPQNPILTESRMIYQSPCIDSHTHFLLSANSLLSNRTEESKTIKLMFMSKVC